MSYNKYPKKMKDSIIARLVSGEEEVFMKKHIVIILLILSLVGVTSIIILYASQKKINDNLKNDKKNEYSTSDRFEYDEQIKPFEYYNNNLDAEKTTLSVCINKKDKVIIDQILRAIDESEPSLDIEFNYLYHEDVNDKLGLTDNEGNVIDISIFNDDSYYEMENKDVFLKMNDNYEIEDINDCFKNVYKESKYAIPCLGDIKILCYNEKFLEQDNISNVDDILSVSLDGNIKNLGISLDNEQLLSLIASVDYNEYNNITTNNSLELSDIGKKITEYFTSEKIEINTQEELLHDFKLGKVAAIIMDSEYIESGSVPLHITNLPKFSYEGKKYDMLTTLKIGYAGVNKDSLNEEAAKIIVNKFADKIAQYNIAVFRNNVPASRYVTNYIDKEERLDNFNLDKCLKNMISYADSVEMRKK